MENRIDPPAGQQDRLVVAQIALVAFGAERLDLRIPVPAKHPHLPALCKQHFRDAAAEKSTAACYQRLHATPPG